MGRLLRLIFRVRVCILLFLGELWWGNKERRNGRLTVVQVTMSSSTVWFLFVVAEPRIVLV